MSYSLLWVTLAIAVIDWRAVAANWRRLEYFAKPAVMIVLFAWLISAGGTSGPVLWFATGLIFSLGGDIFLMLPKNAFIPGLLSFLLAHVAYIVGYNQSLPPLNLAGVVIVLLVLTAAGLIYRQLAAGMKKTGKKLQIPVLIYSGVISIMLISALATLFRPDWELIPALFAALGGTLFYISDTLLAWNRFVSPLAYGRVPVHITYHLGQIAIVAGAALHYLS